MLIEQPDFGNNSGLDSFNVIYVKEEALDRTIWRNRFGRGVGPVVRQNTE
jgi:hypothetical protein